MVRTLLEADIRDARRHLIMPSLPPDASPLEDWVDFRDLAKSMKRLDLGEAKARSSSSADEERPQEAAPPVNVKCMNFLRASKAHLERAKAACLEAGKQQEAEFYECEEEPTATGTCRP